jgi:hypothetical protein
MKLIHSTQKCKLFCIYFVGGLAKTPPSENSTLVIRIKKSAQSLLIFVRF